MMLSDNTHRKLRAIAAICFLALSNTFICFVVGAMIMLEMQASFRAAGSLTVVHNYISLVVAIIAAIVCNVYLVLNHKIREYIRQSEEPHR
jgi:hypothetical protein